jgi:hypothetical protein
MLNIAASLNDEPSLISSLVSVAIDSRTIDTLQRVLAMGPTDASKLRSLQRALADRESCKQFDNGMRGERIAQMGMYQYAKKHGVDDLVTYGTLTYAPPKRLTWMFGGIIELNMAKALELMVPLCDTHNSPLVRIQAAKAMQKRLPLPTPYQLVNELMPVLTRACELEALHIAQLRAAQAALAAERFRLDNHRRPQSLGDLVPRYLESIPLDPFDERPLRYRIDPDRIIIYSIAANLADDGGDVEPPPDQQSPIADAGFQLLNPQFRGCKITDIK